MPQPLNLDPYNGSRQTLDPATRLGDAAASAYRGDRDGSAWALAHLDDQQLDRAWIAAVALLNAWERVNLARTVVETPREMPMVVDSRRIPRPPAAAVSLYAPTQELTTVPQ
jgi:hypothetical protein